VVSGIHCVPFLCSPVVSDLKKFHVSMLVCSVHQSIGVIVVSVDIHVTCSKCALKVTV
jgi:hypothetical protein